MTLRTVFAEIYNCLLDYLVLIIQLMSIEFRINEEKKSKKIKWYNVSNYDYNCIT